MRLIVSFHWIMVKIKWLEMIVKIKWDNLAQWRHVSRYYYYWKLFTCCVAVLWGSPRPDSPVFFCWVRQSSHGVYGLGNLSDYFYGIDKCFGWLVEIKMLWGFGEGETIYLRLDWSGQIIYRAVIILTSRWHLHVFPTDEPIRVAM